MSQLVIGGPSELIRGKQGAYAFQDRRMALTKKLRATADAAEYPWQFEVAR